MDSYFSSRDRSPRSQADALPSEFFCPSPLKLCNVMLRDRYRILKRLGEGGFGKTFLALDEQAPDSFCVIKQLLLHSQTNYHQQSSALFQQEAQRLAAWDKHPQMPQLLDVFEQDGQAFIVQEWIDGWTLEQEIADGVPFDELEVWQLLRDLLPVLQHLHDRQIIHRDIKPTNIIRRSSSSQFQTHPLVLVDFGIAKRFSDIRISTEPMLGSAEYAAPEQIRGQAVFASDLYSLGLTCLHLLTQTSPFDLYDMANATWKWQAYLTQPISPHLKSILCTLLQPAIRRRYQSAAEVLTAINALGLDALDTEAHPVSTQVDGAITPTALTFQRAAKIEFLPAAIAAINAVQSTHLIAATIYSPQTQRWHHLTSETAATALHRWEARSPIAYLSTQQGQSPVGWRLFAVAVGTATASIAMTCLWLSLSIIFLTLAMPPHSSAIPSNANSTGANW